MDFAKIGRRAQEGQDEPKLDLNWAQVGPKLALSWPQVGSKLAQHGLKLASRWLLRGCRTKRLRKPAQLSAPQPQTNSTQGSKLSPREL